LEGKIGIKELDIGSRSTLGRSTAEGINGTRKIPLKVARLSPMKRRIKHAVF
jgi:hypothetical protein